MDGLSGEFRVKNARGLTNLLGENDRSQFFIQRTNKQNFTEKGTSRKICESSEEKKDERLKPRVHTWSFYVVYDSSKNVSLLLNFVILRNSFNLFDKYILPFVYSYMNFHACLQMLSCSVCRNLRFGIQENVPTSFWFVYQERYENNDLEVIVFCIIPFKDKALSDEQYFTILLEPSLKTLF